MNWLDWIVLFGLLLSMLVAFFRGAAREIIGLAASLLGLYLAYRYSPSLELLFESQIETPELRYMLVFTIIVIVFLIIGAIGGRLLRHAVNTIGLMGLDKSLGIIFGLARGLLLVVIFIMVANFTPVVKNDYWKASWFVTHLQDPAERLLVWIDEQGLMPEVPQELLDQTKNPESTAPKKETTKR
jgi:membrane protein required for colicin V production